LIAAIALGCSSSEDDDGQQSSGSQCPAGQQATDSGCIPVQHEGDCAAGSMPIFGVAECEPVGWTAPCPTGFEADPSGWGCRAIAPEGACPAGTMPRLGSTECQPVGWSDCPSGFEPDPSGWGCRDVVAAAPCSGATRAVLGSETCVPIGNCAAAFPPAGATLFVDDSYTAAQLDATHFAAIEDAIAVAVDGDTIAVESGNYADSLLLTQSVTVVGRCAAEVIIDGSAGLSPGVRASGAIDVEVRGVTLIGHVPGVQARTGAQLTVREIVVQTARDLGVFGQGADTLLVMHDSVVRGTQTEPSDYGFGVNVESGATVEVHDSEITESSLAGVFALGAGSTAALFGSIVRDTKSAASGGFGHGLHSQNGGRVVAERSSIANNRTNGGYTSGSGSRIELSDSIVRDTQTGVAGQFGHALQADSEAALDVQRSALIDNRFITVFVFDEGSTASFTDSTLRGTLPGPGDSGGRAISLQDGAQATLEGTALVDHGEYGLVVGGVGTRAELVDSLIRGTRRLEGGEYGWGINCADGGHVDLIGSALEDNEEYGMAAGKGGTATVEGSIVRGTRRSQFLEHDDDGWRVQGIGVQEGSQLGISRSLIADNTQIGIYIWDFDPAAGHSHVEASDLVVRTTLPAEPPEEGEGNAAAIVVGQGASANITNAALVENSTVALLVMQAGATANASNLVVRATGPNNTGLFGRAIAVQDGGVLTLASGALVDNAEIALFVAAPATSANVSRSLIADTRPAPPDGAGRGIGVQYGGALSFSESTVLRSAEVGMHLLGQGTFASLSDAIVGETTARTLDGAFGNGIVAQEGSALELRRARVFGSAAVGLAISASTALIEASLFDHNPVALHLQDGSTLVASPSGTANAVYVSDDTRFVDNATRLGSGVLALPSPVDTVAEQ
jgi:hypothetical protein